MSNRERMPTTTETSQEDQPEKRAITASLLAHYFDFTPLDDAPDIDNPLDELQLLADDMNAQGLTPFDLLSVPRASFSYWETAVKKKRIEVGEDGKSHTVNDIEVVPSRARRYDIRPQTRDVDLSEFIITPPPVNIRKTQSKPRKVRHEKVLVDLPDIQYALREHRDGSFTPVHDPRAIDVALQITKDIQPDVIVSGGDELDLPELGRFDADSTHFMGPHSVRRSVLGLHRLMAQLRADNQNAEIPMVSSNHVERWDKFWLKHAPHLAEVRPADDPEGYPLLSIERALGLKALDIDYIAGYAAAMYRVNDRLITFHGDKSKNNGSTAQEYLKAFPDQSVMFHHTHRMEREMRTLGGRVIQAFSNGCLANTQGAVPSYHNAVDTHGEIVPHQENWQNGIGVVHYTEGNGAFHVEQVAIDHNDGYRAFYDGKWYEPRPQAERTWEQFEPGLTIREYPAALEVRNAA